MRNLIFVLMGLLFAVPVFGQGTVNPGPQYSVPTYPNSGTSSTVGPSNVTTDSTLNNLNVPGTTSIGGPNPYIDTSSYHMRAVTNSFQAVGTCTNGSPTVTFSSGSFASFQPGDGLVLYGCGATNTLTTPIAPTVTPSLLAGPDALNADVVNADTGGGTSYCYEIVARDRNGGLTAPSSQGCTASGWTLGPQTSTASSVSRSGNTVTVITTTANGANGGAIAFLVNSSDATFDGFFKVASATPSSMQFTYSQGMDTRFGATSSATGTSVTVYNCNHLSWTASGSIAAAGVTAGGTGYAIGDTGTITTGSGNATYRVATVSGGAVASFTVTSGGSGYTVGTGQATARGGSQPGSGSGFTVNVTSILGPWQYYIYGRTSGSLGLIGVTRPGETGWNDCGSTMSAAPMLPDFVKSTPPPGPTNDYLATTIISGAGGSTITLATSASNSASGTMVKFDDGPNLALAYAAAAGSEKAVLHITNPATGYSYVVNSHTLLNGGPFTLQGACLTLNETIEFNAVIWNGDLGGNCISEPQFSFGPGQVVTVNAAFPGFTVLNPSVINDLIFSAPAQGFIMSTSDGYGFNSNLSRDSFVINGTDYMGQAIVGYASSNTIYDKDLFSTNDSSGYGYSLQPLVLHRDDVTGANSPGDFVCNNCFFIGRGMGLSSNPNVGGFPVIELNHPYAQALRTPLFELGNDNQPFVHVRGFINDTSITAAFANWDGSTIFANIEDTANNSSEASGRPGIVTGNLITTLFLNNSGATQGGSFYGQNRNMFSNNIASNGVLGLPSIGQNAANQFAGKCTLGTNCVITFPVTYNSVPVCIGTDQTAANPVRAVPSTTGLTLTGTGTDVIAWHCDGNPN